MLTAVGRRERQALQRFDNRGAQIGAAAFGALIALLGLAGLADSSWRGTAAIYLLFGVYTIVRGLRSSCVVVERSGVTTRSMVRTRRYLFSELYGVEVAVGRTGLAGFGREYLVLHRADGRRVAFKELNSRPPKDLESKSVVRRAEEYICMRLRGAFPSE